MGEDNQQVFISYAWGGESERIANELDADLQAAGIKLVRDKRNLGFKGLIKDFMQKIGRGHAVVLIISDKYLKSPNCMYELVEISRNKDMYDRIFPIVLSDAEIYDPVKRIQYRKYWDDKFKELSDAIKSLDSSVNLQGMNEELSSYDEIRDNVSQLTFLLKDMNTLSSEMHEKSDFADLIAELKKRMGADEITEEANVEEDGADEPAPKPVIKATPKKEMSPAPTTSKIDFSSYLEKIVIKLQHDDYEELEDEKFGGLKFDRAFNYTQHEKFLLIPIEYYHRCVILIEEKLSEGRFLKLEKEIKEYCAAEYSKVNQWTYTLGLIVTNSVSEDVKQLIYDTAPAKYPSDILAATAIAVYSAEENELIYPKVVQDDSEADFNGKFKKYLKP